MIQSVIIIGAGNLATQLAKALCAANIAIWQVYSRTIESASCLANKVGAEPVVDIAKLKPNADLYIFSVKDDALIPCLEKFPFSKSLIVHTAGSIPMSALGSYSEQYGVFYPLQTFSKTKDVDFLEIPICIEAKNDTIYNKLESLASLLTNDVRAVDSLQRQSLHLAAVFVCNFVNHMYQIGHQLMEQNRLSFDILRPLIYETANKIRTTTPKQAQTGPAVRYDQEVMQKQMQQLAKQENLQAIYQLISKDINETHKNNN